MSGCVCVCVFAVPAWLWTCVCAADRLWVSAGLQDDYLRNDHLRVLTDHGRAQAAAVGKALARDLLHEELKRPGTTLHLYSSDQSRANQTAQIIRQQLLPVAQGLQADPWDGRSYDIDLAANGDVDGKECPPTLLPIHKDSMLREGAPCIPEGYTGAWQPAPHEFHEEASRIEAAFRKHVHRASPSQKHDSVTILVCHGNVIRYFLMRAMQLPPGAWLRTSFQNGTVTRLRIGPNGTVSVRSAGEALGQEGKDVTYH